MRRSSMGVEGMQASETSKSFSQSMSTYTTSAAMQYSAPTAGPIQQQLQPQHHQHGMDNDHHASQSNNAHPDAQTHYQNQQMMMNNSSAMNAATCLVCYNAQVDVMLEPCHHQFHASCIDRWLNKDKVCPICWIPIQNQRQVVPHYQSPAISNNLPRGGGGYASKPLAANNTMPNAGSAGGVGNAGAGGGGVELPNPSTMRKGKWTAEESAYCDRLIEEFKKGNLPLAEGTTLRTFLSKLLNCDPMRISKKYTGDQCIGKIIFRRREDEVSKEDMENIRKDLAELEKTYLEREQYNQRRREKRLESELSRDKSRFIAARTLGYNGGGNAGGAATTPRSQLPVSASSAPHYQQPNAGPSPKMESNLQHPQFPAPTSSRSLLPHHHQDPTLSRPPHQQQQQHHNQHTTTANSSHLFNNSHQNGSAVGSSHSRESGVGMMGGNHHGGDPSKMNKDSHPSNNSAANGPSQQDRNGDSFPRVSSIDSFSCLFPRVASIENFQMSNSNNQHQQHHQPQGSFANSGGANSGSYSEGLPSSFDTGSMVKSMSIGDGLNAYFPRIQSLEQLSTLLQEHAPPSPRAKDGNEDIDNKQSETSSTNIERPLSTLERRKQLDSQQGKDEQSRDGESDTHTRLSPNNAGHGNKPTDFGNHIQIPKPLSKMPRSSSGIFPRVPSMDKLPRVPSLDKIPRVPSHDKLPRIPSMDKLPSMDRIPRVPSMDKLSRISSNSDMAGNRYEHNLGGFPSFSNLSGLQSCASYDKLSALGGNFKSNFPRNSSIEDILSLVASSESTGMPSAGSHLQLSALAAVAGEESSHLAAVANDRKRRLERDQELPLPGGGKKGKVSS